MKPHVEGVGTGATYASIPSIATTVEGQPPYTTMGSTPYVPRTAQAYPQFSSAAPQFSFGAQPTPLAAASVGGVTVVGADRNRDGVPDYLQIPPAPMAAANVGGTMVVGVDRNRDGIPDVLQSIPPSPLSASVTSLRQPGQFIPGQPSVGQVQFPASPSLSAASPDPQFPVHTNHIDPAELANAYKETERAVGMVATLMKDINVIEDKYRGLNEANQRMRERQASILAPIINKGLATASRHKLKSCFREWAKIVEILLAENQMRQELESRNEENADLEDKLDEIEKETLEERYRGTELDQEIQEKLDGIEDFKKKTAHYQREIELRRREHDATRQYIKRTRAYLSRNVKQMEETVNDVVSSISVLHEQGSAALRTDFAKPGGSVTLPPQLSRLPSAGSFPEPVPMPRGMVPVEPPTFGAMRTGWSGELCNAQILFCVM
jgi:hypothetical protein